MHIFAQTIVDNLASELQPFWLILGETASYLTLVVLYAWAIRYAWRTFRSLVDPDREFKKDYNGDRP